MKTPHRAWARARLFVPAVFVGALLAACTAGDRSSPVIGDPAGVRYQRAALSALPGWSTDPASEALPALDRSCGRLATLAADTPTGPEALGVRAADWARVCPGLRALADGGADAAAVRAYLNEHFQAWQIASANGPEGLFTGYYEAMLDASPNRSAAYATPVYGLPEGWARTGENRPDRRAIEAGALDGVAPVLMWARDPVDLFMLQIQGSGIVRLEEGGRTRIGYAGDNGHPFVGIGRLMQERGYGDGQSMPAIRAWLNANPDKASALMAENPRYIFFRRIDGEGPIGAQGVPLTPGRSLAVDRAYVPLGAPMWIATSDAHGRPVRRLVVAQDTGGAIKGPVRGDLFWGSGEEALYHAGGMKSRGYAWLLLPKTL